MLRRWTARQLESGAWSGPLARGAAAVWQRLADPVRPVKLPARATVVGIGGATLGGAGKTPTARELARGLAARGTRVVVVASGYRARVSGARVVRPDDDARVVGDEATMLARALDGHGVPTVVGDRRQSAIDLAAELGDTIVVDGLLQAWPERLGCAVLVLDADAPWGSGCCPPGGDLRADRQRLMAAADVVVSIRDTLSRSSAAATSGESAAMDAVADLPGAFTPDGCLVSAEELRRLRLGLVLAIARPERVLRSLALRGIVPASAEFFPDHGAASRRLGSRGALPRGPGRRIEAWLATAKCATKLGHCYWGAPVWTLEHRLRLPSRLLDLCAPS